MKTLRCLTLLSLLLVALTGCIPLWGNSVPTPWPTGYLPTALALTMAAILGFEMFLVLKLVQSAFSGCCLQNNITAFASISTVRASARHKFFSPETYTTPAAVPGLESNNSFINEFHRAYILTFLRQRPILS